MIVSLFHPWLLAALPLAAVPVLLHLWRRRSARRVMFPAVALLMDQNANREEGVFAPFFSHLASTRSGPVQLAMTRGTPLVPVFFFRVGKSGDHVARIRAPLILESAQEDPDKALVRNVERINATIEAAIREAPEQWIWSHRRFKTQPPGVQPIYPSRRSPLRVLRHRLRRKR